MPKTSLLFRAFIQWLLRRPLYRYTYFVLLGNKTAETDREPFTTKDLLPRVRGRRRQSALLFLFFSSSSSSSSFHFFLKRPFPETTALYRTVRTYYSRRRERQEKLRGGRISQLFSQGGGGSRAKKTFPSAAIAWHHWHSVLQRVWWYNTIVLRLSFSCSLPPLPSPSCYCTPANGRSDRKKRTDTKKV